MRSVGPMIRFVRHGQMLDDAPWTWGSTGGWSQGMPEFFQDFKGVGGVYDNVFAEGMPGELNCNPVTWHITDPVDPTEYQNEWLGDVINIY